MTKLTLTMTLTDSRRSTWP